LRKRETGHFLTGTGTPLKNTGIIPTVSNFKMVRVLFATMTAIGRIVADLGITLDLYPYAVTLSDLDPRTNEDAYLCETGPIIVLT